MGLRALLGIIIISAGTGYFWVGQGRSGSPVACLGLCATISRHDSASMRGKRIVQELISPLSAQSMRDSTVCCKQAHLQSIVDMLAYLDELAHEKGQGFCEGTFVIEDYGERIHTFLLSYADTYRRMSSHFGEYKTAQYGIDIPWHQRSALLFPQRKRHLLFGKIGKNLLFIKPENYGTQLRTPTDFIMHTKEYIQYLSRRLVCAGFERADWREERVPLNIIRAWRALLSHWIHDARLVHWLSQYVAEHGIKGIVIHLPTVEQHVPHPTLIQQAVHTHLQSLLAAYDHCHLRRGCEVILRVSELLGATH